MTRKGLYSGSQKGGWPWKVDTIYKSYGLKREDCRSFGEDRKCSLMLSCMNPNQCENFMPRRTADELSKLLRKDDNYSLRLELKKELETIGSDDIPSNRVKRKDIVARLKILGDPDFPSQDEIDRRKAERKAENRRNKKLALKNEQDETIRKWRMTCKHYSQKTFECEISSQLCRQEGTCFFYKDSL